MYQFRMHIHRWHENATTGVPVTINGKSIAPLTFADSPPSFHVSFDTATEILQSLPRMFLEPDGSLAWTGHQADEPWRIEGVLYDAGPALSYVELSGRCPPDEFDQFLAALGWPAVPVMFQWIEAGVFVSEEAFRRNAMSDVLYCAGRGS